MPDRTTSSPYKPNGAPGDSQADRPAMDLESHQPDPMLQMSTGRMGGGGLALVALGVVVILGIVFYGLNGRTTSAPTAPPTAAANSGAPRG